MSSSLAVSVGALTSLRREELEAAIAGDPHAFTIRPEKIAVAEPGTEVPDGACTATGHVREVVYLGALTRYIVTLDVGGELVVMQQNLATSSMEALQVRGKAVRLIWRRSNNRPVEAPAGYITTGELVIVCEWSQKTPPAVLMSVISFVSSR